MIEQLSEVDEMRNENNPSKPTVLTTDEARQGETSGRIRAVLMVSMALLLVAGVGLLLIY